MLIPAGVHFVGVIRVCGACDGCFVSQTMTAGGCTVLERMAQCVYVFGVCVEFHGKSQKAGKLHVAHSGLFTRMYDYDTVSLCRGNS
jgi:hypothetical protein